MVKAMTDRIAEVHGSKREEMGKLWVVPILGISRTEPVYRLLEGDALDEVEVTEVDEGGEVPTLLVDNALDEMVFLMDGQELVGAKQNRILNTDVLVPPRTKLEIPVSCVEAGRWRYRDRKFRPGKSASSNMRARKSRRVHESLKQDASHDADQRAVWDDVEACMIPCRASSPTRALHEAYVAREKDLSEIRANLELPENAVGVAIYRGKEFLGLDLFDRHATLKYFWESLLDSYAIDWLHVVDDQTDEPDAPDPAAVDRLLSDAGTATWETFKSPGLGEDHRLEHEGLAGSALVWNEESLVHMQLFPLDSDSDDSRADAQRRPRLRRWYGGRPRRDREGSE